MRVLFLLFSAYFLCLGTNVPSVSDEELISRSDRIIVGKVVDSTVSWGAEHKYIWTRYEVAVSEVLKGSAGKTVIVSEPGGQLDGKSMRIAGGVAYKPGERVALFLKSYAAGDRTVGWAQGKFSIDQSGRVHSGSGSSTSLDGATVADLRTRIHNIRQKSLK